VNLSSPVKVEPRVLFVSKPIVPPWHDGSKNLVRDLARAFTHARPTVLTTADAPPVGERVACEPVYRAPGRFAPGVAANARVLARLLRGDPHDVWHFVFAPNAASSSAASVAIRARRLAGWRGKVVQTIASAPSKFEGVERWLFGDVVVALSEWTRARMLAGGARGDALRVIPPCAVAPDAPSPDRMRLVREKHRLGDGPIVVYPGDYERSRGAATVAAATPALLRAVPDAQVVFACRAKTPASAKARDVIERATSAFGESVRHVGEIDDMHALLAASRVVAFPVDDLYGKVDLPLVLLEAMALGVPLVLARGGPLESLGMARFVEPGDDEALADELATLLRSDGAARAEGEAGRKLYRARFTPEAVAPRYEALYAELLGG
jgi:phosphatidylinositol alpha-1,6-mannosyltransferase